MRAGAVLVGNNLGQTLLDNPYSMTSMTKEKHLVKLKKLQKTNKNLIKMKALEWQSFHQMRQS